MFDIDKNVDVGVGVPFQKQEASRNKANTSQTHKNNAYTIGLDRSPNRS